MKNPTTAMGVSKDEKKVYPLWSMCKTNMDRSDFAKAAVGTIGVHFACYKSAWTVLSTQGNNARQKVSLSFFNEAITSFSGTVTVVQNSELFMINVN